MSAPISGPERNHKRFSLLELEDNKGAYGIAPPRAVSGRPDGRIDSREFSRTVFDLAEIPARVQEEEQRVAMERRQMLNYLVPLGITFLALVLLLGYQMQKVVARGVDKPLSHSTKPLKRSSVPTRKSQTVLPKRTSQHY